MGLIYRAANMVEAQLIVDELLAGGMKAHVTGGYLSGAIGELPPSEVIGVWLYDDTHHDRARSLIEEFESSRLNREPDWTCNACEESMDSSFGACWQCGTVRSQV